MREQWLSEPPVWIPEREASVVPLAGLKLKPGKIEVRSVGTLKPRVLVCEYELPVKQCDHYEKDPGSEKALEPGRKHQFLIIARFVRARVVLLGQCRGCANGRQLMLLQILSRWLASCP